jgi:hypothetical protein
MLLLALIGVLLFLPALGPQSQAQSSQNCLRCKLRCGVARQECFDTGLPLEICEEAFNECVGMCVSSGICPGL